MIDGTRQMQIVAIASGSVSEIVLKSGCPEGGEVEDRILFWVGRNGAHAEGVSELPLLSGAPSSFPRRVRVPR